MMTIFVCVSCRRPTDGGSGEVERPGIELADTLQSRLAIEAPLRAVVKRVDCLAVCERPCTVALAGQDKWTYLIGDIDPQLHSEEILSAALSFEASGNGIVPLRERPASFRNGVIARVPPLTFKGSDQ
jgi:predicted metal-binding protein